MEAHSFVMVRATISSCKLLLPVVYLFMLRKPLLLDEDLWVTDGSLEASVWLIVCLGEWLMCWSIIHFFHVECVYDCHNYIIIVTLFLDVENTLKIRICASLDGQHTK